MLLDARILDDNIIIVRTIAVYIQLSKQFGNPNWSLAPQNLSLKMAVSLLEEDLPYFIKGDRSQQ
jgi:hypothetical protein